MVLSYLILKFFFGWVNEWMKQMRGRFNHFIVITLYQFRGVGLGCRWRVDMKFWWDWCRSWRAMLLMVAGRDGLLAGLLYWQLIPFFFWIVFRLCLPPCRSLIVDLGQLREQIENRLFKSSVSLVFHTLVMWDWSQR